MVEQSSVLVSTPPTQDRPSKPPLLLYLPGMDGTGDLFYKQESYLRPYFRIQPVPFGMTGSETWQSLAARVWNLIDPEDPPILCGESFGGCLALLMATQHPQRISGLILVNPASSFHRVVWWLGARLLLPLVPPSLYQMTSERGLGLLANLDQLDLPDRDQLRRAALSVPLQITAQRVNLLCTFNPEPLPLEQIDRPTLLIGTTGDRLLPSVDEVNRLAERLPQAKVEVVQGSGHACLLERHFNLQTLLEKRNFLPV